MLLSTDQTRRNMATSALLGREWLSLQQQHEQYERSALAIKLVGMVVFAFGLATGVDGLLVGALTVLFWIQEGVFKTYQGRLAARLLRVESLLRAAGTSPGMAMQLHSEWAASRPGGLDLLAEYLQSAARPTVAFPYLPMLILLALMLGLAV
jgi:hypothetical protein